MTATRPTASLPSALRAIERHLPGIRDVGGRLEALDQLCAYYAFTSGQKARTYLRELTRLEAAHPHPEVTLSRLINTAMLEGLLYNFEVAHQSYREAMPLLEERSDSDRVAEVCIDYAGTCINREAFADAEALLQKGQRQLADAPNPRLHNRLLIRRAYLALFRNEFERALELLHTARHAYGQATYTPSIKDHYFRTLLHSGLGQLYMKEGDDHTVARDNYALVVAICEEHGLRNRLSFHYLFLGNAYNALDDSLKAEEYWRKSIAQEDDSSPAARASAYANLGKIYGEDERFKIAHKMFEKSERMYQSLRNKADHRNRALLHQWRADVFLQESREEEAVKSLIASYEHAVTSETDWLMVKVQTQIADYYATVKDYQRAYEWRTNSVDAMVLYYERLQTQSLRKAERAFEAELKKQENEKLRIRASELQMKALRAQMNPHFIFNALNAIQYDIENSNTDVAVDSLTKFAQLMRSSLAYSEMDRITIEDERNFLKRYLDINATLRFEDKMTYSFTIDDELEDDILEIPTMIIQPYVENSIEHGIRSRSQGHIDIRFELLEDDEDVVRVIIEDDGIGRQAAGGHNAHQRREHRSMGTRITQDRLKLLHPDRPVEDIIRIIDLTDEAGTGTGTRVEVLLPLSEGTIGS